MNYDDENPVRLTTTEIGVMRQIIAWRKTAGVDFVRRDILSTYWRTAYDPKARGYDQVAIQVDEQRVMGISLRGRGLDFTWYELASFTQAVDLLVAYGLLPARFSTAYRAGWDAAYEADEVSWSDVVPPAHPLVEKAENEATA